MSVYISLFTVAVLVNYNSEFLYISSVNSGDSLQLLCKFFAS